LSFTQLTWVLLLNAAAELEKYNNSAEPVPFYYNSGFHTWKIIGYIEHLDQYSGFKEDVIVK